MTEPLALVERARRLAGLSRARRSGASRPTLAAYAAGAKSHNLSTAERITRAAGFDLDLVPRPSFREAAAGCAHAAYVPEFLPRLPMDSALGRVRLPLHLNWSQPGRQFDLSDRRQRARVYEIVLREGTGEDIRRYVDGALLADLWPELVLPAGVRREWQPLIDGTRGHPAAWVHSGPLTPLQIQAAWLFFSLPDSAGFAVAGGAPLVGQDHPATASQPAERSPQVAVIPVRATMDHQQRVLGRARGPEDCRARPRRSGLCVALLASQADSEPVCVSGPPVLVRATVRTAWVAAAAAGLSRVGTI